MAKSCRIALSRTARIKDGGLFNPRLAMGRIEFARPFVGQYFLSLEQSWNVGGSVVKLGCFICNFLDCLFDALMHLSRNFLDLVKERETSDGLT